MLFSAQKSFNGQDSQPVFNEKGGKTAESLQEEKRFFHVSLSSLRYALTRRNRARQDERVKHRPIK